MKKLFNILGAIFMLSIALTSAFGMPDAFESILGINETILVGGASIALVPAWFVVTGTEKTFQELSNEDLEKLEVEDLAAYHKARYEADKGEMVKLVEASKKASEDAVEEMLKQIDNLKDQQLGALEHAMISMGETIKELKEKGITEDSETFKSALKNAWDDSSDDLEASIKNRGVLELQLKATQTYGDITDGEDFAQMRPGIVDIAVRRPKIRQLFSTIPVSTEFLKYVEQDTVVRDAQNVAKCAAVVSTTKETIVVRSIETKVIKDMMDFCRLFASDYPFMESRMNKLINESLALRIDSQLLLGTGAGEETFSIDSVASEFSAANPACVLTASIQDANMVDLILGMQTQIVELGQQNAFEPNVVLVNKCDWFKLVESRKDLNNNYIDARVNMVNGVPFIGGMMVIWSPLVVADSLYVFDSTKGEVVDRQQLVLEVAFENRDNWEKEIATLKGYERLNFLVPVNWANAFMKSTTVAVAIAAIDKP